MQSIHSLPLRLATVLLPCILILSIAYFISTETDEWKKKDRGQQPSNYSYARDYPQETPQCTWPVVSSSGTMPNRTWMNCDPSNIKDTVVQSGGRFSLSPLSDPSVRCWYRPLGGGNESEIYHEVEYENDDEQFVVRCSNGYQRAFVHFDEKRAQERPSNVDSPSLAVLVLDSLSPYLLARALPLTLRALSDNDFHLPSMYQQVDTIFQSMTPFQRSKDPSTNLHHLLAGLETAGNKSILEIARDRGCQTLVNSDAPNGKGIQLSGILGGSAHFNANALHLVNEDKKEEGCSPDGRMHLESVLSVMSQFSTSFPDHCHFSLNHVASLNVSSPDGLKSVDERLTSFIRRWVEDPTTERSSLVILSSSGNSASGSSVESQFVESRSPLFAIRMPREWRKEENTNYSLLNWNMDKFLTPLDVFSTLSQIMRGDFGYVDVAWLRDSSEGKAIEVSLIQERVTENRTCLSVNMDEDDCLCMKELPSTPLTDSHSMGDRLLSLVRGRTLDDDCITSFAHNDVINISTWQMQTIDEVTWLNMTFVLNIVPNPQEIDQLHAEVTARYYRSTDSLEYVEAHLIPEDWSSPVWYCSNVDVVGSCANCINHMPHGLAATDGPSKGFLRRHFSSLPLHSPPVSIGFRSVQ